MSNVLETEKTEIDDLEQEQKALFTVTGEQAKTRIDKFLTEALEISRKRAADLLEQERVTINGQIPKASAKVQENDIVEVDLPPAENYDVLPEEMDLDIVYEDNDILVVNKPKGMVVHPAPGHVSGTLVNGLMAHCKDLSGINGVMRPGIVHRIDKDTSGLLVVAKNDAAHESLSRQLADKTCRREYLAIVHHPFSHTIGTVNAPIGRDPKDRQKMAVTAKNSKEAVTHFEVLENFKDFSYLRLRLETGRTHQIRVHMAYIEHPVAGDPKYGPRKTIDANGQLLHAYKLELIHPVTGEKMEFEAPLDPVFENVLEELRKGEL
jgi:23S rRNA pseudouridine1911/1915/1917 synthase